MGVVGFTCLWDAFVLFCLGGGLVSVVFVAEAVVAAAVSCVGAAVVAVAVGETVWFVMGV